MTYQEARLQVLAFTEEALGDRAYTLMANEDWREKQITSLVLAINKADPASAHSDLAQEAITAWGADFVASLTYGKN